MMERMANCVVTRSSSSFLSSVYGSGIQCSSNNLTPSAVTRRKSISRQQIGLEDKCFLVNVLPCEWRSKRWASVCRRAGAPGDDEKSSKRDSAVKDGKVAIEGIGKALGDAFGGPLWFAVLLILLAIFGGGYVYLIYKYADFSDIPILNGPKR